MAVGADSAVRLSSCGGQLPKGLISQRGAVSCPHSPFLFPTHQSPWDDLPVFLLSPSVSGEQRAARAVFKAMVFQTSSKAFPLGRTDVLALAVPLL